MFCCMVVIIDNVQGEGHNTKYWFYAVTLIFAVALDCYFILIYLGLDPLTESDQKSLKVCPYYPKGMLPTIMKVG